LTASLSFSLLNFIMAVLTYYQMVNILFTKPEDFKYMKR